jgi:hypothetical protein
MTAKKERHITITATISKLGISPALQMLYAEIVHLSNGRGYCYANNHYFEKLFNKSDSCIIRWIKSLENRELVFRIVIRSLEGTERRLYTDKPKYEQAKEEHKDQTLTGRQKRQPLLLEMTTGGGQKQTPGVGKSEHPGRQEQTPGVGKSEHHNNTVNITSNNTVEYTSSTKVEESFPSGETQVPGASKEALKGLKDSPAEREEKEKDFDQKEKEESRRSYHQKYKDAWWQFYKEQNNGEEPPKSRRNGGLWNGLKKIQQDLSAVFDESEEKGFQEFVYILGSWPKLKDYYRLQVLPTQIHKNLGEIRKYLREIADKGCSVPYVQEAIHQYKEAFHQLKGMPPNTNGRSQEHVAETLTYLKGFKDGNTWENALTGFQYILSSWKKLEELDNFYSNNFTLSFINGNTSKIIGTLKQPAAQQAEFGAAIDDYVAKKYGC